MHAWSWKLTAKEARWMEQCKWSNILTSSDTKRCLCVIWIRGKDFNLKPHVTYQALTSMGITLCCIALEGTSFCICFTYSLLNLYEFLLLLFLQIENSIARKILNTTNTGVPMQPKWKSRNNTHLWLYAFTWQLSYSGSQ